MANPAFDPATETFASHAFVDNGNWACDSCGASPWAPWHTGRAALLVAYMNAHGPAKCPVCATPYRINKDGLMWCPTLFTHSFGPVWRILSTDAV